MIELGKYWANASNQLNKLMFFNAETSPARRIDIAGVASSILATPTIKNPTNPKGRKFFNLIQSDGRYPR